MSEGDVSLIHDEDVLRRMWQQTEDFSRKKEIRAHMYRLREERLRNLYSPEPTIEGKDLKELSNAGWNVESENKTTDDGHTKIRSIYANIDGKYDVEGGQGQFSAIDHNKQAVTEYHDDSTSIKRNQSLSNTAAQEKIFRQTDDGNHMSSTMSSSSSTSNFHQISSTKEFLPYTENDNNNVSQHTLTDIYPDTNETTQNLYINKNEKRSLRNDDYDQAELISRKIDYPDENTKVIVETKLLHDGTKVTSTRREFRAPPVQSSRSQHTRTETKSASTSSHHQSKYQESSTLSRDSQIKKQIDNVDSQRISDQDDFKRYEAAEQRDTMKSERLINVDNDYYNIKNTNQKTINELSNIVENEKKMHKNKNTVDYKQVDSAISMNKVENNLHKEQINNSFIIDSPKTVSCLNKETKEISASNLIENSDREVKILANSNNIHNTKAEVKNSESQLETAPIEKEVTEIVEKKASYDTDQQLRKISNDLSPTHQAWASSLRSNTPPTTRPSTRASSPGSRTFKSSSSSLRSSVSPDKVHKIPHSRGGSPNKSNRHSPPRTTTEDVSKTEFVETNINKSSKSSTVQTDYKSHTRPKGEYNPRSSISPEKPPQYPTHRTTSESPDRKLRSKTSPIKEKSLRQEEKPKNTECKTRSLDRNQSNIQEHSISPELVCDEKSISNRYTSPSARRKSTSPAKNKNNAETHLYDPEKKMSPDSNCENKDLDVIITETSCTISTNKNNKSTPVTQSCSMFSPEKSVLNQNKINTPCDELHPEIIPSKHYSSSTLSNTKINSITTSLIDSEKDNTTRVTVSPDQTYQILELNERLTEKPLMKIDPDKMPGYMKPIGIKKSTHNIDKSAPNRDLSLSPDREILNASTKLTSVTEDHYKFIKEETKINKSYNSKSNKNKERQHSPSKPSDTIESNRSPTRKSPEKTGPKFNHQQSPSLSRHSTRSPSPLKDQFKSVHAIRELENEAKIKITSKTNSRETSPSKFFTYDKKNRTELTKEGNEYDTPDNNRSPGRKGPEQQQQSPSLSHKSRSPSPSKNQPIFTHATELEIIQNINKANSRETSPSKYSTYDRKNHTEMPKEILDSEKKATGNKVDIAHNNRSPSRKGPEKSDTQLNSPQSHPSLSHKSRSPSPIKNKSISMHMNEVENKETPKRHGKYEKLDTTEFIHNERTNENNYKRNINQQSRQLITPSTSPTRKHTTLDNMPSTGQSSPTTSVSGFVYLTPVHTDHSIEKCTPDTDTEKFNSDNSNSDLKSLASKIPRRSPSPDKRTSPIKNILPRKSSLKKPSADTQQNSPSEKLPSNCNSNENKENVISIEGSRVDNKMPSNRSKPPLERRETYEERCRKILGMMEDKEFTEETSTIQKRTESVESSVDADNKYYRNIEKDVTKKNSLVVVKDEGTLKKGNNKDTPSQKRSISREQSPIKLQDICSTITSKDAKITYGKDQDTIRSSEKDNAKAEELPMSSNIKQSVTEPSPSKTITKVPVNATVHSSISSRSSTSPTRKSPVKDTESAFISQTQKYNRSPSPYKPKSNNVEENRNIPSEISSSLLQTPTSEPLVTPSRSGIPTKNIKSRSASPVKKVSEDLDSRNNKQNFTDLHTQTDFDQLSDMEQQQHFQTPLPDPKVNNSLDFIMSEREQEILDKVQKSLRKLSPDRNKLNSSKNENKSIDDNLTLTENDHFKSEVKNREKTSDKKSLTVISTQSQVQKINDTREKNIQSKLPRNTSPSIKSTIISSNKKNEKGSDSPPKSRSISPKKPVSPSSGPHSPQLMDNIITKQTGKQTLVDNLTKKTVNSPKVNTVTVDKDNKIKNNAKLNNINKISTSKMLTAKMTYSKTCDTETKPSSTSKTIKKGNSSPTKETDNSPPHASLQSKKSYQSSKSPLQKENYPRIKHISTNKPTVKKSQQNLSEKPKSATILNSYADNDDVIIDIQQAKSSRENSPDHICPTPVNFLDDVDTPRLPDEVSEPDDDLRKRVHTIIHETESIVDDIIEISEDEELFVKKVDFEHINENDSLLNVTDKVTKSSNDFEKSSNQRDCLNRAIDINSKVYGDLCSDTLESDECLLTVSEKVNKFAKRSECIIDDKSPLRNIMDEYDKNTVYQDDYTKLSVNDKAHLFKETAEKSKCSNKKTLQKVSRQDLSDIDESLKSDDCLLSVSDKVNKFVKTAESIMSETLDVEDRDKKIKEQHDKIMRKIIQESDDEPMDESVYFMADENHVIHSKKDDQSTNTMIALNNEMKTTNETKSSNAKHISKPNIMTIEKPVQGKISGLRSSDTVKKAKALFENIATTQKSKDSINTRLTDIGVVNKIAKIKTNRISSNEDDEFKVNIKKISDQSKEDENKIVRDINSLGHCSTDEIDNSQDSDHFKPQSPLVSRQKSPINSNTISKPHSATYTVLTPKRLDNQVLEKSPAIPSYQRPTKTSQIREELKSEEETDIGTRRSSGKFGVDLKRTSVERSMTNNERRRSIEQHQPCIEDIYDIDLLEQMLEKVVGYEQRRRIRAQIRIAKKKFEDSTNLNIAIKTSKSRSVERQLKNTVQKSLSPDRHSKQAQQISTTSQDCNQSEETPKSVINNSPIAQTTMNLQHSTEKVMGRPTPKSAAPVRQKSPEKRNRSSSPNKTITPKSKSNRFNEYASAYMKKVGLNETEKIKLNDTKDKKTSSIDDRKTKINYEHSTSETKVISSSKIKNEKTSSKEIIESTILNSKRSPSPANKLNPEHTCHSPVDRLYQRSPSPDFKRSKTENDKKDTKITHHVDKKVPKVEEEEKPSWVTNRNLKKITSESRTYSNKKIETDKQKQRYRAVSPSKIITKPIDVITSSYGPGPLDAEGRPLFGIKALRNGSSNYQVKGTVIRQEFHSRNGGEPEGTISVTAYSTEPEDLEKLLQSQGEKPSRLHGLAAITTTKKFGGDTGTTLNEAHSKEERVSLEQFTHSDRRLADRIDKVPRTDDLGKQGNLSQNAKNRSDKNEAKTNEKKTVRQSSVKSLTEKYIKSASDTSRLERAAYPKAGLILRTNIKDTGSSDDQHRGLHRADSENSVGSGEDTITNHSESHSHTQSMSHSESRSETHSQTHSESRTHERSFLDSSSKVTGVQDILTRMKNADIVIEDGDTSEDTEARALLNKFLGATVLMAGMQSYVSEKPTGNVTIKQETIRSSGEKTSTTRNVQEFDLEQCWDERVLRKLLDECTDYEQRRKLRARLRTLMAEQEACASAVTEALAAADDLSGADADAQRDGDTREKEEVTTVTSSVRRNSSEKTVTTTTTTKTSKVTDSVKRQVPKPVSPFTKFRQLEKQNSTNSPKM